MAAEFAGLLAGWKHRDVGIGTSLTLQVVHPSGGLEDHALHKAIVLLSDERLCSLVRDLHRAADARNLRVDSPSTRGGLRSGLDNLIELLIEKIIRPTRPTSVLSKAIAVASVATRNQHFRRSSLALSINRSSLKRHSLSR